MHCQGFVFMQGPSSPRRFLRPSFLTLGAMHPHMRESRNCLRRAAGFAAHSHRGPSGIAGAAAGTRPCAC